MNPSTAVRPALSPPLAEGWLQPAYALALDGAAMVDVLQDIARALARQLALPLVFWSRRLPSGATTAEAQSSDTALWLELQKLPERWDGTVTGNGPCGGALRSGRSAFLALDDEGLLPWREAARDDGIASIAAVALEDEVQTWALVLCAREADRFCREPGARTLAALAAQLEPLLARLDTAHRQRLLARALENSANPAFITDLHGEIVWSNAALTRLTGYRPEFLRGQNPRVLKSGQQGLRYYRELWSTLRSGRAWSGETIDRDRNGRYYTIRQTITPFAAGERISHYLSLQLDITQARELETREALRAGIEPRTGLLTRASFEAAFRAAVMPGDDELALLLLSCRELLRLARAVGLEFDEVVRGELGRRIRAALPAGAAAGVIDDSDFGVLLKSASDPAATLQACAQNLRAALAEPWPVMGEGWAPEPRIAVVSAPAAIADFTVLLHAADRRFADEPMAPARRDAGTAF